MEFFTILFYFILLWILTKSIISIAYPETKRCPGDLPPGPPAWPIVGNLFQLRKNAHASLARLSAVHGPIMTLKLGRLTTVVISSSHLARQVLQHHDLSLSGRTPPDAVHALGHSEVSLIWLPPSPRWRAFRKICSSNLFTTRTLDATAGLRRKKVEELVDFIRTRARTGEAVNVGDVVMVTSLNLLSNTIFSVDLAEMGTQKAADFRALVGRTVDAAGNPNISNYFPVLGRVDPQGTRRRLGKCMSKWFQVTEELVAQRLASGKRMGDVLDALLGTLDGNTGEHLIQRSHIKHLTLDLFLAALDTTSITVEWAMAELLRNPSILGKLREEIRVSVGEVEPISEVEVFELPFLQAVVKETFRVHPPGPLLVPRKAMEDVHINGYVIPKDSQVVVNAWAIGREASVWKNPDEFWPERFVGSAVDVKGGDLLLIPFGMGRRICPGFPLALRMVHLVVAALVHHFEWRLEGGMRGEEMEMEEKFQIVLRKAQPLRAIPMSI